MTPAVNPIDRLQELGGEVFLVGDRMRYRIPADEPEARQLIAEIRQDREAIIALLRDRESQAPSHEEVKAMLPPGIRLRSYEPKAAPFAVAPVSVVTDAGKFYRSYLRDLACRLKHPDSHAVAPLVSILAKLQDAGLDLTTDGTCQFER